MIKKQILSLILCLPSLLVLAGCAGYRSQPLKNLLMNPSIKKIQPAGEQIKFAYKVFTEEDCKKYLGREVIKSGYQPIQITILNKTTRILSFMPKNLSLPCVPNEEVREKVYTSTASRAASYGVAGLVLPVLFIPAVVDSVWSSEANEQLSKDYTVKTLEDQYLKPDSMINGLVFTARENFTGPFSLTLVDDETNEKFVLNSHENEVVVS